MPLRSVIDLVILCPIPIEFNTVRKHLHDPKSKRENAFGVLYDLGKIKTKNKIWQTALVETGAGVRNMQSQANDVIRALRPSYIFLLGIAGSIKDAQIGDIVIADKAYGYESGKETINGFQFRPDVSELPAKILTEVKSVVRKYQRQTDTHQTFIGPIASGEKVLANLDSPTVKIIQTGYGNTLAVEMEAIGFYRAAMEKDVWFLNIRGISDLIDGKGKTEHDGSRQLAVDRALGFLLYLLEHLPLSRVAAPKSATQKAFQVRYVDQPLSAWLRLRKVKKGKLHFDEEEVFLVGKDGVLEVHQITAVKRFTMPGDIGANWIKVDFNVYEKPSTMFFSPGKFPGLGSLFGGGEELYHSFKKYELMNQE